MSDMAGNPYQHFEEAAALLADRPGEYEIEKARSLAILALAFEQRTANLIALEMLLQRAGADIEVDAIQERLGLS